MLTYSPSGGLSPYYYKGGYFHGIHYGKFSKNNEILFDVMKKEEEFILKSLQKRRILIDFYDIEVSEIVLEKLLQTLRSIEPRIFKLAISTDRKSLRILRKAFEKDEVIQLISCYFHPDMENAKTWLVSEHG